MEKIVLVLSTVPDGFDAPALARALVEARLAACVSVLPAQWSTYQWQGEVETAREHQILIKTTEGRVEALRSELRERHPYQVPEFLVLPVAGGDEDYLSWIRTSAPPDPTATPAADRP